MAVTVNIDERISLGSTDYLYIGQITMDSSYATGGENVDATGATGQAGPQKFKTLIPGHTGGYVFEWINASQKLKAFTRGAHSHDLLVKGGQIASTTNDVATYATSILGKQEAADVTVAGVDSATKGGVLAAAASALAEVASTTDLSAVVVPFIAIGD